MPSHKKRGPRYPRAVRWVRDETKEGLDHRSLDRVLQGIRSELRQHPPPPRRRGIGLAWLGLGAVAAAAAILLPVLLPRSSTEPQSTAAAPAQVSVLLGTSGVAIDHGNGPTDLEGEIGPLPAEIRLQLQARLHLRVDSAADVAIQGPARVSVADMLHVHDGVVALAVRRRPKNAPFELRVGQALITVRGTRFVVRATGDHLTSVMVQEGTVEILPAGGGETTLVGAGGRFGEAPPSVSEALCLDELSSPDWAASGVNEAAGYVSVFSEPSGASLRIAGDTVGSTPLMLRLPPGDHDLAVTEPGFSRWRGVVHIESGEAERLDIELAPTSLPSRRAPEPLAKIWRLAQADLRRKRCGELQKRVRDLVARSETPDEKARAEMLTAECHLRLQRKKQALGAYRRIAKNRPDTPSAEAALFETAKLLAELGEHREALDVLGRYERLFPKGRFAAAAAFRTCEASIQLERLKDAEACLRRFRRSHRNAARAGDALYLLGALLQAQQRWGEAAEAYRAYLDEAPEGSRAERAAYQLVHCLRRAGLPGANRAVRDYQRRFPDSRYLDELEGSR